jgi:hypothetical protein
LAATGSTSSGAPNRLRELGDEAEEQAIVEDALLAHHFAAIIMALDRSLDHPFEAH